MIDPEHRGRFVYSAYEAQVLKAMLGHFDVIFTTAGGGAQGMVRRRLGYREVGRWRTFSLGANLGYHAARAIPGARAFVAVLATFAMSAPRGFELEETHDIEPLAAAWMRSEPTGRIEPHRTRSFLEWRITRHPKARWRHGLVTRSGRPVAGLIWREMPTNGGAFDVSVDDLFTVDPDPVAAEIALRTLIAHDRNGAKRFLVRTLDDDSPLAQSTRHLEPRWAAGRGIGSPMFVRSHDDALQMAPWSMTQILTQGF